MIRNAYAEIQGVSLKCGRNLRNKKGGVKINM